MPFFRQNAENQSGLSKRTVITLASAALAAVFGISVGVPLLQRSQVRTKEVQLNRHLQELRSALQAFVAKSGSPPQSATDLVAAGVLVELPVDPFTGRADTWRISKDPIGIRSGSDRLGLNGKPYSSW